MQQIIFIIHIVVALLIILLILLQKGKGADIGASFGSGASQTVFGSRGATSFMVKFIAALAAIFFMTSLGLNFLISKEVKEDTLANTPSVLLQKDAQTKK